MSVVALSDLIFGDLLTETNMKPWWEKIRGYIFGASMTFALSYTYLTLDGITLYCLPIEKTNANSTAKFTTTQAYWTNSYCGNGYPWFIRIFGALSLTAAFLLLVMSSYWLYLPKVIDSFVTFVDLEKIITSVTEPVENMKNLSCEPHLESNGDSQTKLREVCNELWKGGKNVKLKKIYLKRNLILISGLAIISASFGVLTGYIIAEGDQFRCQIDENDADELMNSAKSFPTAFLCSSPLSHQYMALAVLYTSSIAVQIIPILVGMWKWKSYSKVCGKFNNIDFLRFFWKNAKPNRSKTLSEFIGHVCGTSAISKMQSKLPEAIKTEDYELVNNYVTLEVNGGDTVLSALVYIFENEDNSPTYDKIIIQTCEYIPSKTETSVYKELVEKALKDERWNLLAGICNVIVSKRGVTDAYRLLCSLDVNFDMLDDKRQSILYYVKGRPLLYPVVSMLNEDSKKLGFKLYVHRDGKSFPVEDELGDAEVSRTATRFDQSQIKILEILNDFKRARDDKVAPRLSIRTELSKLKFQKWDQTSKDLAESLNEYHEEFVALLNAFVVTHDQSYSCSKLDCGVDVFELNSIFRHFLSSSDSHPFVPTAARHILRCFTRKSRDYVEGMIKRGFQGLSPSDRDDLLAFIEYCNQQEENGCVVRDDGHG